MAAKKNAEKKISINKLDTLLTAEKAKCSETKITYDIDGEDVDILVKRSIPLSEMQAFVENVAENVFMEDEATGETVYAPALRDIAWGLNFIAYFTNLKVEVGAERVVDMMYATGLFNRIEDAADAIQLRAIEVAINSAIEFRKQTILSGERIKLNYLLEQLDKAMPMLEQNANLLAGMRQEDLTKAVQAIGNMDEGKLAKAVLKEQEGKVIEMPKPKKTSTRKKKPSDVD